MVVGDRQVGAGRALLSRPRSCSSGSAAGSSASPRAPRFPTRRPAFAPTTARRRCSCVVVSNFTYTLESLIQAGKMLVAVEHVPIETNETDARVTPVRVDRQVRAAQRARDLPRLRHVRAAAGVLGRRLRCLRVCALAALQPVRSRLDPQRRLDGPRPVADPRRGALPGRSADVRARDHRRRAGRPAGHRPARVRARARVSSSSSASRPRTSRATDRRPSARG